MPDDPIPTITITTAAAAPPGRARTRTETAIDWTTGHALEITGVTAPLVAGAFTTAWLDLISAAVALWWAVHQVRENRLRAEIARHTLTAAPPTWALPTSDTNTVPLHRESGHR